MKCFEAIRRLTAASSSTTNRIEPAASARNRIDSDSLTHACPIRVPTNVGPPPIRPRRSRNRQLGRTGSPESGATMPKPSVALCRPKPMIRTIARLISPVAPAWPIARPSEKLCSPIPVAIRSDSQADAESDATQDCSNSAADAAPGPSIAWLRLRFIQPS